MRAQIVLNHEVFPVELPMVVDPRNHLRHGLGCVKIKDKSDRFD